MKNMKKPLILLTFGSKILVGDYFGKTKYI